MHKMNQDVKRKWVRALKSGKFEQTVEALKDNEGYCCLGVLCELYQKEHPQTSFKWTWYEDRYHFGKEQSYLPKAVQKWAGLKDSDPFIMFDDYGLGVTKASDANDHDEMTFEEIAEAIKKNL